MQNNIKSALKSMLLKMGAFFRRQQWKEIFIFIFFLLLSFGFWFLQSLQQDYERKIELPLRYRNVPSEWVLSGSNPEKISIQLKDKGTTLMYYSWRAKFNPIDISISGLPRLSDYSLHVTSNMLETAVSKQLISSTSIISMEPREVALLYDSLSSRLVSVVENISIVTKPGYQISDSIKISHPEILLFGSRSILDTLDEVRTKLVVLDNVSKTKELTVHLDLPEGVKSKNETVKLTIPVEEFTEKKLQLPVSCSDIPDNYTLRLFPSSVEVSCNIPVSQFRGLTESNLEIMIPFKEFEKHKSTGKIMIRLTKKPSWVMNAVIAPNELEFIIEQSSRD